MSRFTARPGGHRVRMKVTRNAAVLWVVAILAAVVGVVIPELRFLLVVAAIAVVACLVMGFGGRSRPDVELTPDEPKLTSDERR